MLEVYDELRRLAQHYLGRERLDHTLQATALVHEAYIRLAGRTAARWEGPDHFLHAAAREMRRVLIDHARRHCSQRRGHGLRVPLEEPTIRAITDLDGDLIALDQALTALASFDSRKAQVVELRYFGGLTIDETAGLLDISGSTVVREWRLARAWLYRELGRRPAPITSSPIKNACL